MARRTKEEAAETRRQIIEAAIEAFTKLGVANTSLDEIARRAGVTRGAVYWHFKNKLAIFEELDEELHTAFTGSILADLNALEETCGQDALGHLEALCTELLIDVEINERKKNVLTLFFVKCDYSGDMRIFLERQKEAKQKTLALFARYFERAINEGQIPKSSNAKLLSLGLWCLLTGICQEFLRDKYSIDLKKDAGVLLGQFFAGLNPVR